MTMTGMMSDDEATHRYIIVVYSMLEEAGGDGD